MNPKTVLILGRGGYVASNLAELFRNEQIRMESIATYQIIKKDNSELARIFSEYEYIIWALGPGKVKIQNIYSTVVYDKCFELFNEIQGKHIFLSSADLYKYANNQKISENKIIIPSTEYGLFKFILEQKAYIFLNNLCILRLPGIWGNKDKSSLISTIITKALNNKKLFLNVNADSLRDFIHIKDLTQAILLILSDFKNNTYNLTSDTVLSFKDLADNLKLITGVDSEFSKIEKRNDLVLNIEKFKKDYNYKSMINFMNELKVSYKKH